MQPAPDPVPARRRRATVWLEDENRFWLFFIALLALLAALKGFHLPGEWPLTESLVDYSHGFVKRGLLGTVLGAIGISQRHSLSLFYFAELSLLLALLGGLAHRSGLIRRAGLAAPVALFAGSYAVTYLFHIVGYPDIVNALLLVALLLVRDARRRFLLALPVVAAALLIHEAFLPLFAPVLLVSFYLQGLAQLLADRRRTWRFGLLLAVFAAAVTLVVALQPTLAPEEVDAFADSIWNRADFVVREDFFQVYLTTLPETLRMMIHLGWQQYLWWTNQVVSVCVLGPALLLLLHFSRRLLGARLPARHGRVDEASTPLASPPLAMVSSRWAMAAVLLAVLSPLTLHLVALDGVRWNVWVVVDAFLTLCLLAMHLPGARLELTAAERHAVLLAIALGMASGYGFFNYGQVNPYPFFPSLLRDRIRHHDKPLSGFSGELTSRSLAPAEPDFAIGALCRLPTGVKPGIQPLTYA